MKNSFKYGFVISLLLSGLAPVCSGQESANGKQVIKVAVSRCSGTPNYEKYSLVLQDADSTIECYDMFTLSPDSAIIILSACDALLLSGGPDVHPLYYNRAKEEKRCSIDSERDTLEFALIKKAREMGLPVLGICRGLQIMNVALGGSLIVDIPEDMGIDVIHRGKGGDSCGHMVEVVSGTILSGLSGIDTDLVNSFHHQGINGLAPELKASAYSDDGLIEAVEWANPFGKPFFIAIQWHPERMNQSNPLSSAPIRAFILAAKSFNAEKKE